MAKLKKNHQFEIARDFFTDNDKTKEKNNDVLNHKIFKETVV